MIEVPESMSVDSPLTIFLPFTRMLAPGATHAPTSVIEWNSMGPVYSRASVPPRKIEEAEGSLEILNAKRSSVNTPWEIPV